MADSLTRSKWVCKYHIVFTPKYRRKIDYWGIREDIREIIRDLCKRKGAAILEGKSTMIIFECHANLKYKFGNRQFWATGYYVSTVGIREKALRKYIQEQEKHDQINRG